MEVSEFQERKEKNMRGRRKILVSFDPARAIFIYTSLDILYAKAEEG